MNIMKLAQNILMTTATVGLGAWALKKVAPGVHQQIF